MKPYLHPIPIACVLIAAVGGVMGNVMMVILGVIVAVAAAGILSARQVQQDRSEVESLSADGRSRYRPISKQVEAIEGIEGASAEAVAEARRLSAQVVAALLARDKIKAKLRGREDADRDLGEARLRLEFAAGEEKSSLEVAIASRSAELAQYDEAESQAKKIELRVHEAESALVDLKTRLMGATINQTEDASLRDSLARIHALTAGYEELEQTLKLGSSHPSGPIPGDGTTWRSP